VSSAGVAVARLSHEDKSQPARARESKPIAFCATEKRPRRTCIETFEPVEEGFEELRANYGHFLKDVAAEPAHGIDSYAMLGQLIGSVVAGGLTAPDLV
jgi:hypothetical protein